MDRKASKASKAQQGREAQQQARRRWISWIISLYHIVAAGVFTARPCASQRCQDTFERRMDGSSTNNKAVLQGHQIVGGPALQPLQEKRPNVGGVLPPSLPSLKRLIGRDINTLATFCTVGVVRRRV